MLILILPIPNTNNCVWNPGIGMRFARWQARRGNDWWRSSMVMIRCVVVKKKKKLHLKTETNIYEHFSSLRAPWSVVRNND